MVRGPRHLQTRLVRGREQVRKVQKINGFFQWIIASCKETAQVGRQTWRGR